MKAVRRYKIISALAFALVLTASLLYGQTKISQEPVTHTVTTGDDLLLNSTNSGTGSYTTHRVSWFDVLNNAIMTNAFPGKFNGWSSNQFLVNSTILPTNIFTGPGTLTVANNSHVWTVVGGTTTGVKVGWQFVVGVDQYIIMKVNDATHWLTYEASRSAYTTQPYTVYPNGQYFTDINGNPAGFISSDGGLGVVGQLNGFGNSGAYYLVNGTNSWMMLASAQANGNIFGIGSSFGGFGAYPFYIVEGAPYYSLGISVGGDVAIRDGITNFFGNAITMKSPTVFNGTANYNKPAYFNATGLTTTGNTVSGTANGHTLTGAGGTFSGHKIGDQLLVNGNAIYTAALIPTSSTLYTVEPLQATYSSVSLGWYSPPVVWTNTSPLIAGLITADGSVAVLGPDSGATGRMMFINGQHSQYWQMDQSALGYEIGLYSANNGGGSTIVFSGDAPYDSIRVLPDGTASFGVGITNFKSGTLSLRGPIKAPEGISASAGVFTNGICGINGNPNFTTLSVGASPYSYTNNGTATIQVFIDAGVVSQISIFGNQAFTSTGKTLLLSPGNYFKVTYSVAPTINTALF